MTPSYKFALTLTTFDGLCWHRHYIVDVADPPEDKFIDQGDG
jgi:hypothetical protein